MGMAASQARLLSITARLTNNENCGQSISYSKQRLADQTQQITNEYNEALDATKLTVLTGFNGAEANYTDISYGLMTGLQMAQNTRQYVVTDTKGRVLVEENIANAYKASNGNYNTFLANLGYSQSDMTVQYTDKLSATDTAAAAKKLHNAWDKYFATVGINLGDEEHDGFLEEFKWNNTWTTNNNGQYLDKNGNVINTQGKTAEEIAAILAQQGYSFVGSGYTSRLNVNEKGQPIDKDGNVLYKTVEQDGKTLRVDADGDPILPDMYSQDVIDNPDNKVMYYHSDDVQVAFDEYSYGQKQEFAKNKDQFVQGKANSEGKYYEHDIYTLATVKNALNNPSIYTLKITKDGSDEKVGYDLDVDGDFDIDENDTYSDALLNLAILGQDGYKITIQEAMKDADGNIVKDANGEIIYQDIPFDDYKYETFDRYFEVDANGDYTMVKFEAYSNDIKNNEYYIQKYVDKDGNEIPYNEYSERDVDLYAYDYTKYEYTPINYEGTTQESRDLYDYAMALTESFMRNEKCLENAADAAKDRNQLYDMSAYASASNTENKAAINYYRNIFTKMHSCGYFTYTSTPAQAMKDPEHYVYASTGTGTAGNVEKSPLKDNIAFEGALRNGTLRLEYYSSTDKAFKSTNISDDTSIQEVADERAIARAESKYTQDMADLENKDKKFDLELKKLDTEHSALQTEYESLKNVVDKNVENSFKTFG